MALPPVPASCRGDWRGMQLEVIGINDSPWRHARKHKKWLDRSRTGPDRSQTGPGTSPATSPGTGPGSGPGTASDYLQSAKTGPGTGPGTGQDIESCWYRIPPQTAAETRCHLKQLQTPVSSSVAASGLAPVFQDRTGSQG